MTRPAFVRKFWPLAFSIGEQWGLNPVAIISHALKESGADNWRAAARHNYFGFLRNRKHLVFSSDEAGFTAYAKRVNEAFPQFAEAGNDALAFARAVAYSKNPTYVNESASMKALYAKTLYAIYRSVARDVERLGLRNEAVAGAPNNQSGEGESSGLNEGLLFAAGALLLIKCLSRRQK